MIADLVADAAAAGASRKRACEVLGIPMRTLQDWARSSGVDQRTHRSIAPSNALSSDEVAAAIAVMTSAEYCDLSPKQIVPLLADREGRFLASESTFHRILRRRRLSRHRSAARPPTSRAPARRVATGRYQVWSWDITWLRRRDAPGRFYYLYMVLDVWSRCIVGWTVEEAESDTLAAVLMQRITEQLDVDLAGVVLHSDNGGPMRGRTMLAKLEQLGVIASLSRPRVSNDNPFSESLFKTLKYRPGYPTKGFATIDAARAWVTTFVAWYNTEHLHSEIRYVTPHARHFGTEAAVLANRVAVYATARTANPQRWSGKTRDWSPIGDVTLHPDAPARPGTSPAG